MSCSPFEVRDYFLSELPESGRREMEHHLKACEGCRLELERLRVTGAALLSLPDEEIPRRIGFVSDRVFEPSPLRRWLAGFWGSAGRLAFASAAMVSCAIVYHAQTRPAPVIVRAAAEPRITAADVERAVQKAVAASEVRTKVLLAETERRNELDRKAVILAMEENLDLMRKRLNRMIIASAEFER